MEKIFIIIILTSILNKFLASWQKSKNELSIVFYLFIFTMEYICFSFLFFFFKEREEVGSETAFPALILREMNPVDPYTNKLQ